MQDTLWDAAERRYFPRNARLRSSKTRDQYRYAIDSFGVSLGHVPALADLDDDLVLVWQNQLLDRGLSAYTVRERVGRVLSLWTWLAKRAIVPTFPAVQKPEPPQILPTALRFEQVKALFQSANRERGLIDGIPASLWWVSYLGFVYFTGERKSAALACRIEWIDLVNRWAQIPPQVRKSKKKWGLYRLRPELVSLLSQVIAAAPNRELIWPWPRSEDKFYYVLGRIVREAGLPNDRKHKIHCLRVTLATHVTAQGGNATRLLMHDCAETTAKHYLDPRLIPQQEIDLPVPW